MQVQALWELVRIHNTYFLPWSAPWAKPGSTSDADEQPIDESNSVSPPTINSNPSASAMLPVVVVAVGVFNVVLFVLAVTCMILRCRLCPCAAQSDPEEESDDESEFEDAVDTKKQQ